MQVATYKKMLHYATMQPPPDRRESRTTV